jgi:hypothetical protein
MAGVISFATASSVAPGLLETVNAGNIDDPLEKTGPK